MLECNCVKAATALAPPPRPRLADHGRDLSGHAGLSFSLRLASRMTLTSKSRCSPRCDAYFNHQHFIATALSEYAETATSALGLDLQTIKLLTL